MKIKFLLLSLLLAQFIAFSQDSTSPVFKWAVKTNKLADHKYELIFSSPGAAGTQLYAPSQDLDGTPSAELIFNDSSIVVESFTASGNTRNITSAIFANKQLTVTEGNAEWKAVLQFKNAVPAQLLGKLSVFFNRGDEFSPDLPFDFNASL